MIKRHPLLVFFPLAYALSWYPWLLSLVRGTRASGPNPLGPLVAAIVVTAVADGKNEVIAFAKLLLKWRVGFRWYAIVFFLPLATCLVAGAFNVLLGAPAPNAAQLAGWRGLLDRFIFIFLFIGLGEEPGWRGFALPRLQKVHSPLVASLILAAAWGGWHLPLVSAELKIQYVPAFVLGIFSATILHTWIYNHTHQSVLLQMLFHSAVNTFGAGYVFPMFTGTDLTRLWWLFAVTWCIAATLVIASDGSLGLSRSTNTVGS